MENNELYEALEIAITGCGVELYDIEKLRENENHILRVSITSKEGITLDKCAQVSNNISPILDLYEPMSGKYNLEVSSPGVERKLKTPKHFQASVDEFVEIKDFSKNKTKGKLVFADDEKITLLLEDESSVDFLYSDISQAKTYFQW
ncbi:MAG: ribosome maturation factor RimP [Arcobacter butzleri]|jgi:ribosome maturation factor RimP|nr:ribosome maturation factor RimP [Arcobacteraceae bacterium]MDY0365174.1 ribosome maturation factor RimP [Arcobacteraceae bacterium]NLO16763.1 ribosome maturation factor RimP [Aliarcobacter butzleri]